MKTGRATDRFDNTYDLCLFESDAFDKDNPRQTVAYYAVSVGPSVPPHTLNGFISLENIDSHFTSWVWFTPAKIDMSNVKVTVTTEERQIEALADYAHQAWSGWMEYMLPRLGLIRMRNGVWELTALGRKANLSAYGEFSFYLERWLRQMQTPYAELSEEEKESDRQEARKMLEIIQRG